MAKQWHHCIYSVIKISSTVYLFIHLLIFFNKMYENILANSKDLYTSFLAYRPGCGAPDCGVPLLDSLEGLELNKSQALLLNRHSTKHLQNHAAVASVDKVLSFRVIDSTRHNKHIVFTGIQDTGAMAIKKTIYEPHEVLEGNHNIHEDSTAVIVNRAFALDNKIKLHDTIQFLSRKFFVKGLVVPNKPHLHSDLFFTYSTAERLIESRIRNTRLRGYFNIIAVESKNLQVQDSLLAYFGEIGLVPYPDTRWEGQRDFLEQTKEHGENIMLFLYILYGLIMFYFGVMISKEIVINVISLLLSHGIVFVSLFFSSKFFSQAITPETIYPHIPIILSTIGIYLFGMTVSFYMKRGAVKISEK